MSLPVIDTAQSILGYKQGEGWTFQPGIFISAGTLHVAATGLPTGITISSTTGLLTCDGTTPAGVYVIGVRADDGSLFTSASYFTVGIEATTEISAGSSDAGIDIDIDVITRKATLRGVTIADGEPMLSLKQDDVVLFNVRFFKYGIQLDPSCSEVLITWRKPDEQSILVESANFDDVNSGATAYFQVPVAIAGTALDSALEEGAGEEAPGYIDADTEIQWKQTVSIDGITELVTTTESFKSRIYQDTATD